MVIYLDDYRKARKHAEPSYIALENELFCVNWNPAVAVAPVSLPPCPSIRLELDDENEASEAMMHAYSLATQI